MDSSLTPEEIRLLLKDMTELCLRPPEGCDDWMFFSSVVGDPLPNEHRSPLHALCQRLDAMRPFSTFMVGVLFLAPLAALCLQIYLFGPLVTLGCIGVFTAAGLVVILRQGRRSFSSLAASLSGLHMGRTVPLPTVERGLSVAVGLLLLLPDPLTSLLAVLFIMPDVHLAAARWVQRHTAPVYTIS